MLHGDPVAVDDVGRLVDQLSVRWFLRPQLQVGVDRCSERRHRLGERLAVGVSGLEILLLGADVDVVESAASFRRIDGTDDQPGRRGSAGDDVIEREFGFVLFDAGERVLVLEECDEMTVETGEDTNAGLLTQGVS